MKIKRSEARLSSEIVWIHESESTINRFLEKWKTESKCHDRKRKRDKVENYE